MFKDVAGRLRRQPAVLPALFVTLALGGLIRSASAGAAVRDVAGSQVGSPAEELRYLNAQRTENGIRGGLQDVPGLSLGCYQFENIYVPKLGQYPHEEVPGQGGFTTLGNLAASLSDLANEVGPRPLWGDSVTDNAWADAPLHLVSLFSPMARYAWFGSGPFGACLGTASANPLQQAGARIGRRQAPPTFFSLPGDGVSDVWPIQVAEDVPFTPQQAVDIPAGRPTGPNIILFPEGAQVRIDRVDLRSAHHRNVPVRVVTPTTPAPLSPTGWPAEKYMGEESGEVWFVIPPQPLRGDRRYTLTVQWLADAGRRYTQRVRFKTLCQGPPC